MTFENKFDYIAIPKGQAPGGPIQASDGSWYLVLPLHMTFREIVEHIRSFRSASPITASEVEETIAMLKQ
ncbi:hypothetical protein [Falsochrobactrum ovis]|uniref:Uncharacterized protein n=1 Tax=Falsochrobactrum ovis TaxID=1293442 RepID=A0A364JTQ8_9HYPH|nr:hypothetical protein [Falsochrobactrum ovis]RAK27110.1 hypothetical protein C7374_111104 [Falsochrobactrum ovis]